MLHRTFTAELHCQHGRVGVVETPLAAHPLYAADQDGWLCTEDYRGATLSFRPITFEFVFIEEKHDRTLYRIQCADTWEYRGARLQQNKNGWLGLYGTHVAGRIIDALNPVNLLPTRQTIWKIETLQPWDGDIQSAENIEFYLRDKDGYRVAHIKSVYTRNKPHLHHWFLNAGNMDGEILRFQLRNITVA
ncbi:hypothetical protein C4Q28_08770 [Pseudomonas sp. SWI6]|uniref:Uncharacterized protein n=1 Tax=Pseudomonas taiwanensis TaxID=470150 RepID=A0ABR6VA99_9PSED|nr:MULTISPECIES: hypothetical protein [Pseudomonas]AGZ36267.1 hypothetical protein PVLB_17430 [Pseudomonas sp. VLB120]AVD82255.1 hypothetical protein C4Q28_08770 [Pseudomonas sp. SWI6]AVD89211.1 hypothetical protein C4Q26_19540 [Pseudomonas sp. SWI44]MBC3477411.1 hypothetical protein [Pseudomonas taiwanensis]MBC3492897.1 hypothetical protein [Pseudomonas taiwanensis]